MLKLQNISIFIMLLFLTLQAFIFGKSDLFSFVLWGLSASLMFFAIFKIQLANRKTFRAFTNEGGLLYKLLSHEKSPFVLIVSVLTSFFLAFVILIILKGMLHNHGLVQFFTLLFVSSYITYMLLVKVGTKSKQTLLDKELNQDIAVYALNVLQTFFIAIVLNFVLVLLLSFFDTYRFLHSQVTIQNFDLIATENAIVKNDSNHYSRIFINAFILIDYFKLSAAKLIIEPLVQMSESKYFGFYVVIFFFNFVKYFAFSLGFVLLQKGLESFSNKVFSYIYTIKRGKK